MSCRCGGRRAPIGACRARCVESVPKCCPPPRNSSTPVPLPCTPGPTRMPERGSIASFPTRSAAWSSNGTWPTTRAGRRPWSAWPSCSRWTRGTPLRNETTCPCITSCGGASRTPTKFAAGSRSSRGWPMVDVSRAGRAFNGVSTMVARRSLYPPVRFLLLTPGRAGSTLLMSLLGSAPGVRCDEEALRTSSGDPTSTLRRRAVRAAAAGATAWGTSVHPEHLLRLLADDPVEWVGRLHDDGHELLTLHRRNPLHHVLSAAIAWERAEWHYIEGAKPSTEPIRLDPMAVLREANLADERAQEVRRMVA